MSNNNNVFSSRGGASLPRARARFLAQAIQLEEHQPSTIINAAIYFTSFILVAAIAWAAFTQVDEVTSARGEIVPAGLIHDVQHLEGGIVSKIAVRNGDKVREGDLLLSFSPPASQSELTQTEIRRASFVMEKERLQAILDTRTPVFGEMGQQYPALARKQMTIYNAQLASYESELGVIDAQIRQKEQELNQQQNKAASVDKKVKLLDQQVAMRLQLVESNVVSESDLITTKTSLAEAQSEQRSLYDGIKVSKSALNEAEKRKTEITARFKRDTELEAGKVGEELAEVEQTLIRAEDRVNRLDVYAPLSGIVQDLSITRINAVVDPGQIIMQLVPTGDDMIVEARLSPSDIGHIHPGQHVEVKVDSYDSARFGIVAGIVERISASTYLDEKKDPYFRTEISLNQGFVGANKNFLVSPGMTVTADIKTGSKSILDYLLKPISRGFNNAFRER
ncbi:HlyD family type I secretion periplasmic adaptor subunit [Amphritea balenae]|uniref:Membrane fusion protein (MFP) family protein n=1 Tax=Amphritea balenae TaxID=452629 RepID=A0A3P1SPV4_9GAMM|nr:HlyD family type I secretion periplasmic adaptor subunit [Amphritea balenae]RRC98675.1 HlyD family type I secretion periplasmic adaptor subunit [Amphritea balenae]GGK66496.1 HlyD family type I secretion membrane fusion protein [Amphritea balenae]